MIAIRNLIVVVLVTGASIYTSIAANNIGLVKVHQHLR